MLEIGSLVDGKYRILSEVGHGGMSIVYMALNEKANKTWAIKEARKDGKLDFNTVKQGLLAEFETLKKLSHPHLVGIADVIDDEESFLIVMDYLEGRSLDKALENGAQAENDVVKWAMQLCDVFGYLHSRTPPIIYRDLKPSNIMLKPDGDIVLYDFGTAKNYETNMGETRSLGTAGYAAPEQYGGLGRTDARTDIYCLGMTMFHLLTNVDPCQNLITDKSIRSINPALSVGLDAIIRKCTEASPDDRYQTCAELMYDLENYKTLEPLHKKKQRKKFGLFVASLSLSVLLGISGVGLTVAASKMASDTYETKLYEASKTTDYETKIALYEECIAIPQQAGNKEAYLALIQAFKENDSLFSVEEAKLLEKLIKNNKTALQEDRENYTEICFETGKLFWYYYDYGDGSQITRAKSAIEWFQDVLNNAPEGYRNLGMSKVYANIGIFYRDITTNITEANDKGEYKTLFENLRELMDTVAADEGESEIVRLELIELTRGAIQQYATKFKVDGISASELTALYDTVASTAQRIETTADKTTALKETVISNLSETKSAIDAAYNTGRGGDVP